MPAHRTANHTPFRVPAISAAAWLDSRGGTFRRGDIRSSDDATYPATEAVRAAIAAEYDGDIGTLRDLGQRFTGANGEHYPSWRMRDIAELIGVDTRNRGAIDAAIMPAQFNRQRPLPPRPPAPAPAAPEPEPEPVADTEPPESLESLESPESPESEATMPEPIPTPEPASVASVAATVSAPDAVKLTATKEQKERVYPTREAVCPGCGVTFMSTYYSSSGWTKYHSPGCGGAHRRRAKFDSPHAPESVEPTPDVPPSTESVNPVNSVNPVSPPHVAPDPREELRGAALHAAVAALPRAWTRAGRSRWLEMIAGIVDFAIPVIDEPVQLDWRAG